MPQNTVNDLNLVFAPVSASDVQDAYRIEIECFPPEEAATLDKFEYRQAQAPALFLGCYTTEDDKRTLIGYVCSTLSKDESLAHESMSTHEPSGTSVCIHAVCVRPAYCRRGIGLALLREYVARLESAGLYERVLLITHEDMRSLYEKAGFEWLGRSKVVHGPVPWYEMRKVFSSAPSANANANASESALLQPQAIPANIWDALQRASTSRATPTAKLLASCPRGVKDVTEPGAIPTNKHDLLCPRDGCGSTILKASVATLAERPSVQMEPSGSQSPLLPPLPAPPATVHWWRVTPNAMAFENIGFSRSISSDDGKRLKLLSCAECDLGPLGWCLEGGSEFWLACIRVGYRV